MFTSSYVKPSYKRLSIKCIALVLGILLAFSCPTNAKAYAAEADISYHSVVSYKGISLYNFSKSKTVGCGATNKSLIDYCGYYGTSASIDGNTLKYAYYNHLDNASDDVYITIYSHEGDVISNVGLCHKNDIKALDLSQFDDGLYYIKAVQNNASKNYTLQYFYIHAEDSYLCSVSFLNSSALQSQIDEWDSITSDIDTEDALTLDGLTYPTNGANGHVNHVAEIAEFSHSLVKESWSDEAKVFTFTQWICSNIAYDKYKVNTIRMSRAKYASNASYDAYKYDEYFAWYNHVGVCWDYTNILAIMCRANNIPCTSVENYTHTWNAVYINEHWIPVDITLMYHYECSGENPERIYKMPILHMNSKNGYDIYSESTSITSHSEMIWTYETASKPYSPTPK